MNQNTNKLSRRMFLKKTSIGVTGAIVTPTILSNCAKGANDRVLIAHIGLGGRGFNELKMYFAPLSTAYSVATCDPFKKRRETAAEYLTDSYRTTGINTPGINTYLDFEEILQRKDIDAVHITTPDHWHVPAAIKAARAGKHMMLAKPLGLSYPNYKILEKELKANDVRFHYGTQQRTLHHMQLGIDMIQDGLIGEIEKVELWCPGKNPVESPICNEVPVPDDFDFDKWTGPAPLNTYCPERVTNNSSWFQWDYSIGFLAGWGAHPIDIMIWGMKEKLNGPYSCYGTGVFWEPGGIYNNIYSWDVNYEYESGVKVHFVSLDVAHKVMLDHREIKDINGTTFYGSKGWISLSRGSAQSSIPEIDRKLNNFPKNPDGIIIDEATMGQIFVDVVKGKLKELCPLEDAIISDSFSHMANIAIRTGKKITWDPANGEIKDDHEAFKLFIREMRAPYQI